MKKIGFIGLGLMGGPMAANVARGGFPLTVYNRTPTRAAPLQALGAEVVTSPREVADATDVVITMLSDASAVEAVVLGEGGLLEGGGEGKVLIDMSTVSPFQSRRLAAAVVARGWAMLDAPVFGSTGPAKEGTLGIMVGGEEAEFEGQRDVLSTMGKYLYYFGPQGSGALAKLCFNLMVAAQVVSLAEAMSLARKGGLDLRLLGEALVVGPAASALVKAKADKIVEGDFRPAFPLKHMHKDLGLIVRTADALGAAVPASAAVHQLYTAARTRGHGDEDFCAIYKLLTELAGLE